MFEKLYLSLVLFGLSPSFECPKISSLASSWIFLARVQPVPAVLEFSDHDSAELFSSG
jgi:hypothetical protein